MPVTVAIFALIYKYDGSWDGGLVVNYDSGQVSAVTNSAVGQVTRGG
jgi:hypothetical protein